MTKRAKRAADRGRRARARIERAASAGRISANSGPCDRNLTAHGDSSIVRNNAAAGRAGRFLLAWVDWARTDLRASAARSLGNAQTTGAQIVARGSRRRATANLRPKSGSRLESEMEHPQTSSVGEYGAPFRFSGGIIRRAPSALRAAAGTKSGRAVEKFTRAGKAETRTLCVAAFLKPGRISRSGCGVALRVSSAGFKTSGGQRRLLCNR